jgi:hypothetical protein
MRYERPIEEDGKRPEFLFGPKRLGGFVTGHAVVGHGAAVTNERGIGILMTLNPEDAAALLADPSFAKYLFRERQNGKGRINTPITEYSTVRIVTGYDDAGRPVVTKRVRGAEFVEHEPPRRVRVSALPTLITKLFN